ncbi:hypothetical protein LIA77_04960 [Sarocladium implicatum]|nr:hypothetical protein LIA77_04960 [Sarocladium implicatum]
MSALLDPSLLARGDELGSDSLELAQTAISCWAPTPRAHHCINSLEHGQHINSRHVCSDMLFSSSVTTSSHLSRSFLVSSSMWSPTYTCTSSSPEPHPLENCHQVVLQYSPSSRRASDRFRKLTAL